MAASPVPANVSLMYPLCTPTRAEWAREARGHQARRHRACSRRAALPRRGDRPRRCPGARGADHGAKGHPHGYLAGGCRALAQGAVARAWSRSVSRDPSSSCTSFSGERPCASGARQHQAR
jgi:hypothetical protein